MGLDNYWKENQDTNGTIQGTFKVCGGICSGNGNDSFRGKVYDSIIQEITGISLYQETISSDQIKTMNELIQKCNFENAKNFADYNLEEEEWESFQKMWQAHSDANHYLISWW